MSSEAVTNPPTTESKTAKKKRAKVGASGNVSSADTVAPVYEAAPAPEANGGEGSYESPYLKELQRNIRNATKKLHASQKVDAILADNPEKTLDELVAAKKINADQKASAEKKPALLAAIAQLEDQIDQYKKFGQEYEQRFAAEKAALKKSYEGELEKANEAVLALHLENNEKTQDDLLVLSKFLRAAAAKRVSGDENSNENRAFEGTLLLVYGGEQAAVAAMQKLISGADEKVPATDSQLVDFTYAQVKQASLEHAPNIGEDSWTEDAAQSEAPAISAPGELPTPPQEAPPSLASDPTLVNAGMTELNDGPATTNGFGSHRDTPTPNIPEQSSVDSSAANAVAEASWDRDLQESGTFSTSGDGWVDVQAVRDPAETDTGVSATPAALHGSNSWAEEVSVEHAVAKDTKVNLTGGDDGFHEVVRDHGRGSSRGRGYRGGDRQGRGSRGGEGGYRGRGGFNRERGDRSGGEGGGYRSRGGRGGGGGFRGGRGRGGSPEGGN